MSETGNAVVLVNKLNGFVIGHIASSDVATLSYNNASSTREICCSNTCQMPRQLFRQRDLPTMTNTKKSYHQHLANARTRGHAVLTSLLNLFPRDVDSSINQILHNLLCLLNTIGNSPIETDQFIIPLFWHTLC